MPAAEARRQALVLAVDLDDLTLGRLKSALRDTELSLEAVTPQRAIDRAQTSEVPVIALVEWREENEAQTKRLCESIRRSSRASRCHVVALGGLSDPALARAIEGPADDVLSRPFGSDVLVLQRLRQAVRAMHAGGSLTLTPRDALDEAVKSAASGDVVVRSGNAVAHIHVQNGFIVWANLSTVPTTMDEIAKRAGAVLTPDVIALVKDECRRTKAHFMDVLVSWDFIEAERGKEAVRTFIEERVKLIMDLPDAVGLFLPKVRQHTEHLRISPEDIPSARSPNLVRRVTPFPQSHATGRASLPLQEISHIFQEARAIDGVVSVAILDRGTGASLLLSGNDIDSDVVWQQLSLLSALGPDAEDVIGVAGGSCFIVRPLRVAPTLALFVALYQSSTTVGLARVSVARIAQRGAP